MGPEVQLRPFIRRRHVGRLGPYSAAMERVAGRVEELSRRTNIEPESWFFLRFYVEKGTDPEVIRTTWSIYRVLDAHEALDLQAAVERVAAAENERAHAR